jgi:outer membrane protein assembly factor BamA
MEKILVILFLLFFCTGIVLSQDTARSVLFSFPDSTFRIGKIYFSGNELTKNYIIEREMSLKPGKLLTYENLEYDINRIYSLQLFNKVDIQVVPDSDSANLLVLLSERWYFYPYPIVGLKDRSWSKIYYGIGVAHTNFSGEKIQVFAEGALGYDPFISLYYSDPWISRENNLSFFGKVYYSVMRNRSLVSQAGGSNFDETSYGTYAGLGKRFSLFTTASVKFEYTSITVSDNKAGRTLSPDGTDKFFSFTVSYIYDTRDLKEYPRLGSLIGIGFTKFGIGSTVIDYQRYSIDYHRYIPLIYDLGFAGRVFGNIMQGGTAPNYGHVYYGYGDKIRGQFTRIIEGENIVGSTVEFHYPIISPRYIRFEQIPIEQFRDIRYALYLAVFTDAGNVWYRKDPFGIAGFESGYGAGLHFLLSYSLVLRLEYAFSTPRNRSGEIVFDVGAVL